MLENKSGMLQGQMQDHPLTLQMVLERMRTVNGDSEVVTLTDDGPVRASYREVGERADKLAAALTKLGVKAEDRVATFMWNSQQHLEVYLAAPNMGAVLHTLNIRLFPEQLVYIVNHARDKVIMVDDSLIPLLAPLVDQFEHVEHYIVNGDGDASALPNPLRYEELLAAEDGGFDWPELDERQAAGLCYTSGTTGNPKGVLYSHRSNILHCLATTMADTVGITSSDRVLPVVPMFHVNAWGFPYAACAGGRRPGHAGPLPPGRAAGEADRVGEGDARGRCADDLARRAARRGRDEARLLERAPDDLRRRRSAGAADARLPGAPRRARLSRPGG